MSCLTLLMGGGCGVLHHELPVVDFMRGVCDGAEPAVDCASRTGTSIAVGVVTALLSGAISVAAHRYRPIRPTIACEGCGGTGWVMDLESTDGSCPHCGRDSFTYRAFMVRATGEGGGLRRVVEYGMHGSALLRRFHATRTSAMNRYY